MRSEISFELIAELVGKDHSSIILEIGSYDGEDSRDMSSYLQKAEFHCFEADPRSQNLFREMQKHNPKLKLYPIALSDKEGVLNFYLSDSELRRHYSNQTSWSASSSIHKPKEHLNIFQDVKFDQIISVQSTTLDKWVNTTLKSSTIDFVWMDVNGAEKEVIKGGIKTFNTKVRYLYTEFQETELYEGALTKKQIKAMLPGFEEIGEYNFEGHFGNVLLKNKKI